jgi:hypothetical protein
MAVFGKSKYNQEPLISSDKTQYHKVAEAMEALKKKEAEYIFVQTKFVVSIPEMGLRDSINFLKKEITKRVSFCFCFSPGAVYICVFADRRQETEHIIRRPECTESFLQPPRELTRWSGTLRFSISPVYATSVRPPALEAN